MPDAGATDEQIAAVRENHAWSEEHVGASNEEQELSTVHDPAANLSDAWADQHYRRSKKDHVSTEEIPVDATETWIRRSDPSIRLRLLVSCPVYLFSGSTMPAENRSPLKLATESNTRR